MELITDFSKIEHLPYCCECNEYPKELVFMGDTTFRHDQYFCKPCIKKALSMFSKTDNSYGGTARWDIIEEGLIKNDFQEAVKLDKDGKPVAALTLLFKNIDELFSDGEFNKVDLLLYHMDISSLSLNILVGLASITRPAKDQLAHRKYFMDKVVKSSFERFPDRDINKLFNGLM